LTPATGFRNYSEGIPALTGAAHGRTRGAHPGPQLPSVAPFVDGARHHWQTLLTHVWPFLHFPQLSVAPQPLEVVPQFMPSPAHVTGVQPPVQTLLVQVCPDGQVPQLSVPPQPSEAVPQLKPSLMHVV